MEDQMSHGQTKFEMAPPQDAGIFGLSVSPEHADLVLIPVPWEATASYGRGTSRTPAEILRPSHQLDLTDPCFDIGTDSICLLPSHGTFAALNAEGIKIARDLRRRGAMQDPGDEVDLSFLRERMNHLSETVNHHVGIDAKHWLKQNKVVGVLGGDHSAPFSLIAALGEKYPEFGILHIDAHHDLRSSYEGFTWSHASIMHNVLRRIPNVTRLVQVGIRDFSADERTHAREHAQRVEVFYDFDLFRRRAEGLSFSSTCTEIISGLPTNVYVSFDIDGLDPTLCPSTGTPVPGGLHFNEAAFLLEQLVRSGRRVIGFDLCEVTPGKDSEWDLNVGARVLYKLCGAALQSKRYKAP